MKSTRLRRFSDASFFLLASLAGGPKHGYGMMQDIRVYSDTHLESGTLYGAIARLEQLEWIEALPVEARRRPYQLTLAAVAELERHVATLNQVATVGKA
jgi:DNA-binding PadR family transcriptional regulator